MALSFLAVRVNRESRTDAHKLVAQESFSELNGDTSGCWGDPISLQKMQWSVSFIYYL